MIAFYSNWTKPFYNKNNESTPYKVPDYELLCSIVSSLKWRENNGNTLMICDKIAGDYYRSLGIDKVWNDIDDNLKVPKNIDSEIYWAAGKLYAMNKVNTPFIMMDTDFIVWHNIYNKVSGKDLVAAHTERFKSYDGIDKYLNFKNNKILNNNQDVKPFNTSLLYIANNNFKDYYLEQAFNMMKDLEIINYHKYKQMITIEQRLLAILAKEQNLKTDTFLSENIIYKKKKPRSFHTRNFSHIWHAKKTYEKDDERRKKYCQKIANIIINDYPNYVKTLSKIEDLKPYFN